MKPSRPALWLLSAVMLYVFAYVLNSQLGGYRLIAVTAREWNSANDRYRYSVTIEWHPRFGGGRKLLEVFWFPLIRLDQAFWHPPIDLTESESASLLQNMAITEFHPDDRESVAKERQRVNEATNSRHSGPD